MKWEATRPFPGRGQTGTWVNYRLVILVTLPVMTLSLLTSGCRQQSRHTEIDAKIVHWTNDNSAYQIMTQQEPIGSTTSWSITTNDSGRLRLYHMHNDTSGSNWIVYGLISIPLPYTYYDTNSGISFLVESDGRHITATSSDGKTLWRRDPFADAHLKYYRTTTPQIVYIGKASQQAEAYWTKHGIPKIVGITYNSSQFGDLDVKTGDFTFGGQD
jgi:hypothetical protein